ncbi:MAG: LA2681 family HEPN domain-containing protein [Pseudomonadota bacterium]
MTKKLDGLSPGKALELIGLIIDSGGDIKSQPALDHASALLDQFQLGEVLDQYASQAHYFRANLWNARRRMSVNWQTWLWKSDTIDGEIFELRRAIRHPGFIELNVIVQAQIYTNLGNILNHIGRFVEAIEYWDRALVVVPGFAMASGNLGIGLAYYASALHDSGHQDVLMIFAARSLSMALDKEAIYDSPDSLVAIEHFSNRLAAICNYYNIPQMTVDFDLENHPMGRGKKEREYRRWCLNQRLFINPLNDVGSNPIAAHDVMTLPSITVGIDDGPGPPYVIHHFNIIKQEFCAARFALYEGMNSEGVHFSDRGVLLFNTLDYPAFGYGVERIKMAFRGAYAVFDKIAFLLNAYFALGHSEKTVNFRKVWLDKGKGKTLHPSLDGMANWPLRGLFWLSKDIFEDNFKELTEPDAQLLSELRNHMEHKFVSVHDNFLRTMSPFMSETPKVGVFDISVDDLISKTLRQLKLARAAIIYLSLAVYAEEKRRKLEKGENKFTVPMILDIWEDDWKRRNL